MDQDFIPRRSTSASIVIKGVKPGENPNLTVMWTILGYPPVGIAVPLFAARGADQPKEVLKGSGKGDNCRMCDLALARRAEVFPLSRGNGKNYMNVKKAQEHRKGIEILEKEVFHVTNRALERMYEKGSFDRNLLP